jgi:GT2 family glycosyltransferase
MQKRPLLSIIYVYYNTPGELSASIASLLPQLSEISYEIVVVDNASTSIVPKEVYSHKHIMVIVNQKNLGYGAAVNQAVQIVQGTHLLILNADVIFQDNAIPSLLQKIQSDSKIGFIGPQFLGNKREILPTCSKVLTLKNALIVFTVLGKIPFFAKQKKQYFMEDLDREKEHNVPTISGACMLCRTETFRDIGGFDERFFLYFEEIDLCIREAKKGYSIVFYPKAKIIHTFGTSTSSRKDIQRVFEQSRYKFLRKYYGIVPAFVIELLIRLVTFSPLVLDWRNN